MTALTAHIRRLGVTARLRREVCRERGWTPADWYRHWPTFGAELEAAIAEVRRGVAGIG